MILGATGVVWHAIDRANENTPVAIKEFRSGKLWKLFPRPGLSHIHRVEILGTSETSIQNEIRIAQAASCPGIARLLKTIITQTTNRTKTWCLVFEKGGKNLHELLFAIKGRSCRGSRVYELTRSGLYDQLKHQRGLLQSLLCQLLSVVAHLSTKGVVHGDLKPDNILLESISHHDVCVKVVDFGSAFYSNERHLEKPQHQAQTPEYAPPEVLHPAHKPGNQHEEPPVYAVDMWSVGAIFLEIATGFPLWFDLKSHVSGHRRWLRGAFATKHRDALGIYDLQQQHVPHLVQTLGQYPDNLGLEHDVDGLHLLSRCLDLNPHTRISPEEALVHPYLTRYD